MKLAVTSVFVFLIFITPISEGADVKPPHKAFKDFLDNSKYDNSVPPSASKSGEGIHVGVGIYLNSVGDIDEKNQEYTVNMYFRQRWHDARLNYTGNITGQQSIVLTRSLQRRMWVPDPFFENGKLELFHKVTLPNSAFRVYPDGSVFHSQRITVKLWCTTHLETFPLDNQTCDLKIMTYRYSMKEMYFTWLEENPIQRHPQLKLSRFKILKTTLGYCTHHFTTGNYSCVYIAIHFQRQIGYYVIQLYVPSCLIVVLSWVSFWLDPLAVPARISLGVLTVLTMSTQMASVASSALPQVSYIKAVDVWLTTCMVFLFAALIEFACANTIARRQAKSNRLDNAEGEIRPKEHCRNTAEAVPRERVPADPQKAPLKRRMWWSDSCRRQTMARRLDHASRILFPVFFVLFFVIYWQYYSRFRA